MHPENISAALDQAAGREGFAISNKVVELHGLCRGCQGTGLKLSPRP
jgi:Fur family zinc uptake transcriptional regulator